MNFRISRYAAISAFCTIKSEQSYFLPLSCAYLKGRKIRIFFEEVHFSLFFSSPTAKNLLTLPLYSPHSPRPPQSTHHFRGNAILAGQTRTSTAKARARMFAPPIIPLRRRGKEMGKHMWRTEDKSRYSSAGRIGLCVPGPAKEERRKTTVFNI